MYLNSHEPSKATFWFFWGQTVHLWRKSSVAYSRYYSSYTYASILLYNRIDICNCTRYFVVFWPSVD